jgi:hypothetical protein
MKPAEGSLVYVPKTGVSVVVGNDGDKVCVAMLRQPWRLIARFLRSHVTPLAGAPVAKVSLCVFRANCSSRRDARTL